MNMEDEQENNWIQNVYYFQRIITNMKRYHLPDSLAK